VLEFYTDEDVSGPLVPELIALGYSVTRTGDVGRHNTPDYMQFAYAVQRGWVLITHNRAHFLELHQIWIHWRPFGLPAHPGLIVIPQPRSELWDLLQYNYAMAAQLIDRLVHSTESLADQVHQWDSDNDWQTIT